MVIWITGYAGAGKSTIAREVASFLRACGSGVVLLDGDEMREAIGDDTGHDSRARLTNAMRICRFAELFERQGQIVVVATMSLFAEVHDWNRAHYDDYLEVLIDVPREVLEARDPKGLYSGAETGAAQHVVGVDLEGELPQQPDLVIHNGSPERPVSELAAEVVGAAKARTQDLHS